MFGTKHLIILAISAILVTVLFILAKRLNFKQILRIMLGIGLTSETVKIF